LVQWLKSGRGVSKRVLVDDVASGVDSEEKWASLNRWVFLTRCSNVSFAIAHPSTAKISYSYSMGEA